MGEQDGEQHGEQHGEQRCSVHRSAATGYGRQAGAYGRGRPTYHPRLAERAAALCAAGAGVATDSQRSILELGAGTGIFTRQLVDNDISVTAVEPVPAMRAALADALPNVAVLDGAAERIPVEDRSAKAVIASQSFHWFEYGPALDEIARVLEPGGHLITVWNVRDNTVAWVAACSAVMEPHAGDTPRHYTMRWRTAIDDDDRFEPIDDFSIANPSPTTPAGVTDRVLSTSFIAALDDERSAEVVALIGEIVRPLGPNFEYPYVSELQAWRYTGD